jgi:hypothetical protein
MGLKWTSNVLKVARDDQSLTGNGSQAARNSHAGKDSASEPVSGYNQSQYRKGVTVYDFRKPTSEYP